MGLDCFGSTPESSTLAFIWYLIWFSQNIALKFWHNVRNFDEGCQSVTETPIQLVLNLSTSEPMKMNVDLFGI